MELLGVYDAEGGLLGEASYVVGKLLGRRHYSLCDITHSPVRRKRSWDEMVAALSVPFRLAHLDELSSSEEAAVREHGAPAVFAVNDGGLQLLLGRAELESASGDVDQFAVLLREELER